MTGLLKNLLQNLHKSEPEVEFTISRKYHCKNCVRKRNQNYTLKTGGKLKFIPIITETHKQCGECKNKNVGDYNTTCNCRSQVFLANQPFSLARPV